MKSFVRTKSIRGWRSIYLHEIKYKYMPLNVENGEILLNLERLLPIGFSKKIMLKGFKHYRGD